MTNLYLTNFDFAKLLLYLDGEIPPVGIKLEKRSQNKSSNRNFFLFSQTRIILVPHQLIEGQITIKIQKDVLRK